MLKSAFRSIRWLCLIGMFVPLSCDNPQMKCLVSSGDFAARYTLVSGDPNSPCAKLTQEIIGVEPLLGQNPDGTFNADQSALALQGASLGLAIEERRNEKVALDPDPSHKPYAFGKYASARPGEDGFCMVPTFENALQVLPPIPKRDPDPTKPKDKGHPGAPAVTIGYQWSNLRVHATPAAIGGSFAGDLEYTVNDCTAKYRVWAVFPKVDCGQLAFNEATKKFDTPTGEPDQDRCGAEAKPEKGISLGSGINPDYAVECAGAKDSGFRCLLAKEPPAPK